MRIPDDFVLDQEETLPFQERIREESRQPQLIEPLKGLLRELAPKKKQLVAKSLNLPIRMKANKEIPDALLIKSILTKQQKKEGRARLLNVLLLAIYEVYGEGEIDGEALLASADQIIERHGFWHFYWALRFYPERTDEMEERLSQLVAESASAPSPTYPEVSGGAKEGNPAAGDKQLKALKQKAAREMNRRLQAERHASQLRHQLKIQERQAEQIMARNRELQADLAATDTGEQRLRSKLEEYRRRWESSQKENEQLLAKARKTETELACLRDRVAAVESERKQIKLQLAAERNKPDDQAELTKRLLDCLYAESNKLCKALPYGTGGSEQRRRIRQVFELIDRLEQSQQEEAAIAPAPPQVAAEPLPEAEYDKYEWAQGTFYRRDHGGHIVLENGDEFNITESMVLDHDLQHEAEVRCKPFKQENGVVFYHIQRVFQGDDRYSPVQHFVGYVELVEQDTWYCVDMNNLGSRYRLHERDVQMQHPGDGDACSFNVLEGNELARLSRLYREMPAAGGPAKQGAARIPFQARPETRSRPPAPFLVGCRIVVIGGLPKWFESVVTETGAEFVHGTGDNPERVYADLRKADALFMLLTATSHHSTWSCIEIAKQNRIPHFTIQGSKSNLRMLLWENREFIRSARSSPG